MSSFPRPHHWYFKAGKFFASFAQTESLKETGTIDFSMDLHVWDEGGANSFHGIRWGNLIEPVLKVDSFPPTQMAGEFGADYQFLSRGASPWGGLGFLTPWLRFPRTSILEGVPGGSYISFCDLVLEDNRVISAVFCKLGQPQKLIFLKSAFIKV